MTGIFLRPGTIDAVFYRSVVEENEYRIPEKLHPQDCIIDIGAHIGLFSYLCWQRGARNIEAFEPYSRNAELAEQNLKGTAVNLHRKAVWRSDLDRPMTLYHSGFREMSPDGPDPVGTNTGAGDVLAESGQLLETVGLDTIIGEKKIKILKLDCEGSEYPILLTSKKLRQVHTIVGEYHLHNRDEVAQVAGMEKFTLGILADLFVQNRFRVEFVPQQDPRFSHVGNFFAYNLDGA